MKITEYLKLIGYDYMPLPIGDGVTDDTRAIQNRIDEGLYAFNGKVGNEFRTSDVIKFRVDIKFSKTNKGKYE